MIKKAIVIGGLAALLGCGDSDRSEIKDTELLKQIQSYHGIVCGNCRYDSIMHVPGVIYLVPHRKKIKDFEFKEDKISGILYFIPIREKKN